jgi:hypothetical protein
VPTGGILGLDQLTDQVGGSALYADLRRYGVDLADLWRGGLSPRQVWWLVEHLPEDSATVAALRGGAEQRAWTTLAHLLATVADAVQLNTWTTVAAHAKRRPAPPKPLPRPGTPTARAARVVTVAEIAARQHQAGAPRG